MVNAASKLSAPSATTECSPVDRTITDCFYKAVDQLCFIEADAVRTVELGPSEVIEVLRVHIQEHSVESASTCFAGMEHSVHHQWSFHLVWNVEENGILCAVLWSVILKPWDRMTCGVVDFGIPAVVVGLLSDCEGVHRVIHGFVSYR